MIKSIVFFLIIIHSNPIKIYANEIAVPNTYQSGQTLTADSLNQNFNLVYNQVNKHSQIAIVEEIYSANNLDYNFMTTWPGWNTRNLNNLTGNANYISNLNNKQFTLVSGKYFIQSFTTTRSCMIPMLRLKKYH